jgi:hypothetical protein
MAKLSTQQRKKMPAKEFALPGGRFPVNDKVHQEKAIQLAPRSLKAGNISASQEKSIVSKAKAKLKGR